MKPCRSALACAASAVLIVGAACSTTASNAASPSASSSGASPTGGPGVANGEIVFANDPLTPGEHQQLYIENADGSDVRQLVTSNFDDASPSISPDGGLILFTRQKGLLPDRIFAVKADGSGLHQLQPGNCPGRRCGDAVEGQAWSPDGSKIVFSRALFKGSAKAPYTAELWLMNSDGSGAHALTHLTGGAQDGDGSWSPDGQRIVFLHWVWSPDRPGVFTIATNGTDMRRVTPVGLNAGGPDWSPDGTSIVFQSPVEPATGVVQNIYSVHPDGTGLKLLTANLDGLATNHATWSPDGSQIVFAHAPSGPLGGDLFVMHGDGSGLHVLAVTPLNENAPAWGRAA